MELADEGFEHWTGGQERTLHKRLVEIFARPPKSAENK